MIGQTDTDSVGNSTSSFHSVDTIKPYTTVGNNNRNWRAHLILWPRDRRLTGRPIQESVGLAGTCLNMRRAYLMTEVHLRCTDTDDEYVGPLYLLAD